MGSYCAWTILVILYQTFFSIILSWQTLECHFVPRAEEAHELTLLKLLYLYDPSVCGRLVFYNHTITYKQVHYSTIVWPETNAIASAFRRKVTLWLCLHVIWLGLALLNVSYGRRPCGFYGALLPLTLTGVTLLVVDVVHSCLFLRDAWYTTSESEILKYISSCSALNVIKQSMPYDAKKILNEYRKEDTSWVAILFAYASIRGVVQWIVNFWIIQDNFLEGLANFRSLQPKTNKIKTTTESTNDLST